MNLKKQNGIRINSNKLRLVPTFALSNIKKNAPTINKSFVIVYIKALKRRMKDDLRFSLMTLPLHLFTMLLCHK